MRDWRQDSRASTAASPIAAIIFLNTKTLKSNARLVLALTATVIASAPICAHAEDLESSRTVRFSKPTTAEAAYHVYALIERNANYACGTSSEDIEAIMRIPNRCVHEAIGRAIHQINNANLAHVYVEKNGRDEAQRFGIANDVMTAKN